MNESPRYALAAMVYFDGFDYNKEVQIETVASPVAYIEPVGVPVTVDGNNYREYWYSVYNEDTDEWDDYSFNAYDGYVPQDVIIHYADGSESSLNEIGEYYGGWAGGFDGSVYKCYVSDYSEYGVSGYELPRHTFYFITDQKENNWTPGGSYTAKVRYMGCEAEYTVNVTRYSSIDVGEEKYLRINEPGEYGFLQFIPTEDIQILATMYGYDMDLCLMDEDMNVLSTGTYNSDNGRYQIEYEAEAGKTYFFAARYNNDEYTGGEYLYLQSIRYYPISAGDTLTANVDGSTCYYRFVPEQDMMINFTSISDRDTYGYLYDENFNELTHNDDGGIGANFSIDYLVTAGKTYYFYVRFYSYDYGSFDVALTGSAIQELELGRRITVEIDGTNKEHYYFFTPDEDMIVSYRSFNDGDSYIYGCVYDEYMNYLMDGSGNTTESVGRQYILLCGKKLRRLLLQRF